MTFCEFPSARFLRVRVLECQIVCVVEFLGVGLPMC